MVIVSRNNYFRYNKKIREWFYSPHFHVLRFGWIENTVENFNRNGWIVKNKGVRESTFATFYYQLSHAGVKKGYHTLTWFGDLSYSKLKIEKETNSDECPVCHAKLKPIYHYGLYGYTPPPETLVEMWVEPEGWHILESKPIERKPLSNEERAELRLNRELYSANLGVVCNDRN